MQQSAHLYDDLYDSHSYLFCVDICPLLHVKSLLLWHFSNLSFLTISTAYSATMAMLPMAMSSIPRFWRAVHDSSGALHVPPCPYKR